MRPVLVSWRGREVSSYLALLYVGLVCGLYAGRFAAARVGLSADRTSLATLILLVPALVGARLWFVASHRSRYRGHWRRIWHRAEGGAALYGGLVTALILSAPVLMATGLPFAPFWDAATVTMLVGMFFVRAGCLLNGCCAGRPTGARLALCLPDHRGRRERRHPVQLFEMAAAALLLAGALVLSGAAPFGGAVFLFALLGYGSVRLVLDGLRLDPDPGEPTRRLMLAGFVSASLVVSSLAWLATG